MGDVGCVDTGDKVKFVQQHSATSYLGTNTCVHAAQSLAPLPRSLVLASGPRRREANSRIYPKTSKSPKTASKTTFEKNWYVRTEYVLRSHHIRKASSVARIICAGV